MAKTRALFTATELVHAMQTQDFARGVRLVLTLPDRAHPDVVRNNPEVTAAVQALSHVRESLGVLVFHRILSLHLVDDLIGGLRPGRAGANSVPTWTAAGWRSASTTASGCSGWPSEWRNTPAPARTTHTSPTVAGGNEPDPRSTAKTHSGRRRPVCRDTPRGRKNRPGSVGPRGPGPWTDSLLWVSSTWAFCRPRGSSKRLTSHRPRPEPSFRRRGIAPACACRHRDSGGEWCPHTGAHPQATDNSPDSRTRPQCAPLPSELAHLVLSGRFGWRPSVGCHLET